MLFYHCIKKKYVGSDSDSVNFLFHILYIIILAITCFNSSITCFDYELCNTR